MKRLASVVASVFLAGLVVITGVNMATATVFSGLLHQASLKSGNYGAGTAIDTFAPDHGGSPHVLGIVNSTEGVSFTPTESDNRSNALINWVIPAANRTDFRTHGTVSFMFKADREKHVNGEIFGDNYGFPDGQSALATYASRIPNGPGSADDQVSITWATCDGSTWVFHGPAIIEYDCWYDIGIAWYPANPTNLGDHFETWVCGALADSDTNDDVPWGVSWGTGSATNVGLGDNHERGVSGGAYGSASGVTFADISIWAVYRPQGDTGPCEPCVENGEEPPPVEVGGEVYPMNGLALLAPWITLTAVIIAGAIIFMRRRSTQS